jgi:hypothetical protein
MSDYSEFEVDGIIYDPIEAESQVNIQPMVSEKEDLHYYENCFCIICERHTSNSIAKAVDEDFWLDYGHIRYMDHTPASMWSGEEVDDWAPEWIVERQIQLHRREAMYGV